MTLEILYKREYIESHPLSFILLLLFAICASVLASLLLAPQFSSILVVCFLVFLLIPIFSDIITKEEYLEAEHIPLINKHVLAYAFLSTTIVVGLGLLMWGIVLPASVSDTLFSAQQSYLASRDPQVLGIITGQATTAGSPYGIILLNNLAVVHAILVTSLIFGSGSLFIIIWNISVFVAYTLSFFAQHSVSSHLFTFVGGVLFHVVLEFSAYALAAVAGCLLATAVLKHPFASMQFRTILKDVGLYYIACIVLLALGAFFEVMGGV